jgi:LysM repeat protein
MNSIRPLATITILAVVGVILYVKINEGPAHNSLPAGQAWQNRLPANVPALGTTPGNQSALFPSTPRTSSATAPAAGGTAPSWPGGAATSPSWPGTASTDAAPPAAAPIDPNTSPATAQDGAVSLPPVPDIPDVPPLQPAATQPAGMPPAVTGLPANIPTAQYGGAVPEAAAPASQGSISGRVPSLGTATPDVAAGAAPSVPSALPTPPITAPLSGATGQNTAPYGASTAAPVGPPPAVTGAPAPSESGPATNTAPSAANDDRYGTVPPASAGNSSLGDSPFAAAWPVIEAALQRQELARAHLLLSQWYGDPSLTPAEAQRVESLLSQLAGTVVYSTEYSLEPPYVVRPGDTLDTIAKQYDVPWQLLAKINGIPTVDGVQPGQQLKVVRGPFSAIIELQKGQLTLTLDGRYAGKFAVRVEPAALASEGQWVVDQKLSVPASGTQYAAASVSADRALVLRSGESASPGTTLLIASGSVPTPGQPASPAIRVSPGDAEELSDILSVGSRVVVRR